MPNHAKYHAIRDKMIMRMLDFKCMHHYGVPEIYKECLANEPPVKLQRPREEIWGSLPPSF